ncbi:MAG: carotenoid 1,2-hydratase [Blastocatellia bacterium]|nr:carotenoid 1,2-hydratase [Blastocatellia bacterium]
MNKKVMALMILAIIALAGLNMYGRRFGRDEGFGEKYESNCEDVSSSFILHPSSFKMAAPDSASEKSPTGSTTLQSDSADSNKQPAGPSTNSKTWREAEPSYRYSFPRDHASHPPYRIEWWYYTGNLETLDGRRFGYQLTFFRTGVAFEPANPSRWAVRDLFMAHFAISDIDGKEFHSFERINRAGIGWAGAETERYRVWNEDWEARLDGKDHLLKAFEGDYQLDLRLTPEKAEVIHGEDGVSRKGASAGNASHYYSITRLRTGGRLTVGKEVFDVEGASWMDHEFGTSFLEKGQVGWDWFSIQLDDGRDLMLFELRRADGSIDMHSSGTLIDAQGRATHIPSTEFSLTPARPWRSEASGASYPTLWQIEIPRYGLSLSVSAVFSNQELRTPDSTAVTYWEGSVTAEGTSKGSKVQGRGYLEMTGYAGRSMGAILGNDE